METREALEDVEIAFLQLEFANKLLAYAELGKINAGEFDSDHLVLLNEGNLHFPTGHFSDAQSISRGAAVALSLAFAASALALDQALAVAGRRPDPTSESPADQLRAVVYMVRCAYAHGIAEPRWQVSNKFRRTYSFPLAGNPFSLDLSTRDGEAFEFEHLGGHATWFLMRDEAVAGMSAAQGAAADRRGPRFDQPR